MGDERSRKFHWVDPHPALDVARKERVYSDIRRWTVMPRGGHFAAMEQPEALAAELRAFFRPLRERCRDPRRTERDGRTERRRRRS
jgi:pimeloyl-ACP methyl ester carboxylesterase